MPQYLSITKKLGNKRRSEGIRNFESSKETNLMVLLILAGDIETNPGPRHHCGFCKKYGNALDKWVECGDCEKRFHTLCSKIENQLLELESGVGTWYCTDCKADCGLYSGTVLNGHKAVQCDRCKMWIHTECSFISDAEYGTLVNYNCSWICPKCEILNFSGFFFSELIELENQNRFEPLSREKGDKSPSPGTIKPSFVKGLKRIEILQYKHQWYQRQNPGTSGFSRCSATTCCGCSRNKD